MVLKPELKKGDSIVILLDGSKIGKGSSTSMQLANLPRGTHTIQAAVVDSKGNQLIQSNEVSFHLLRVTAPRAAPFGG